jgi:hypothetical protein
VKEKVKQIFEKKISFLVQAMLHSAASRPVNLGKFCEYNLKCHVLNEKFWCILSSQGTRKLA